MADGLTIRDLHAGYGTVTAVRGASLEVRPGEVVALLGPNGAGKTTTLLAVSGLATITRGSIDALGRSLVGEAPQRIARLGVAHVPEGRALFPRLSVREHLKIASSVRRTDERIALDLFPALVPLLDRRAGLLSGGEQQMLALARALVSEPSVLMIDEMSLGLAPLVVQRLFETVRQIASERRCAVLIVEQHVQLALAAVDRAYVLVQGEIVLDDTAANLLERPQQLESAYLGSELAKEIDA